VTDPTQPPSRGRHSQPDAGAEPGRPASELLAAWAGTDTLQADGDGVRPRRRRHAPETDAAGVQASPSRTAVDVADVEITGLAAAGIADAGLAAAGLDLSAFGIERPETARRGLDGPDAWPGGADTDGPRTTEMSAVPSALPQPGDAGRTGRGALPDRRTAPSPRAATGSVTAGPTTADRVAADRFADAETDPGWLSATGRPAPTAGVPAPPGAAGPADEPQPAAGVGSLASLFTDAPGTGLHAGHPSAPLDDLSTQVHAAVGTGEFERVGQQPAAARHRTAGDDEHEHDYEHEHEHENPEAGDRFVPVSDHTGGLEVIVPGRAARDDDHDDDFLVGGGGSGGGGGRGRRGGRGGSSGGGRKRRGPVAILLSLIVLAAVVVGIVVGGKALWAQINPVAEDYTGSGSGSVDIRVEEGDSLRAIGGTLVGADVIASSGPFEDAAKANPAATGIQPGVYTLRLQMSGQAALDLLLDPASRQVSKVTIPEGLTVTQILQRLADQAGLPLDQLQAAVADPAALGLPAYANGVLEGFLFPATYDIEPGDTPATVLSEMVAGTVAVLDELQVPEADRLSTITEASIVQAEAGSVEDMGKVARVLDNRLADGMMLQLDTTVNYATGKTGITTTNADRQDPSPYNTYVHTGLPPGAIGNPGEEALRAVLAPTPGDWLFFVVVDPDTGETRFATTLAEHQQNVLLFQQWLQDNPGN
jgi:UPF0755 protein